MKTANFLGGFGTALFVAAFFPSNSISNILGLLGIGLLVMAGLVGSRKWFIPVGAIALQIATMYILMRHRD